MNTLLQMFNLMKKYRFKVKTKNNETTSTGVLLILYFDFK